MTRHSADVRPSAPWRRLVAATALGLSPWFMATPAHAADAVCLFEHVNYQGASWCTDSDTNYVGAAWNDRASSVKLRAGVQAELFEHANRAGRSLKLTGDTANLVASGFNDATSSLRVTVADTCQAVTWTAGVNYPLGTLVKYTPNGGYYKVVNATANGSDGTDPTISTWVLGAHHVRHAARERRAAGQGGGGLLPQLEAGAASHPRDERELQRVVPVRCAARRRVARHDRGGHVDAPGGWPWRRHEPQG